MMERVISRFAALLVAAVSLLSGCGSPSTADHRVSESVDRIEVYYRDFETLAPIHYSSEDLIKSAAFELVLTDRESIKSFHELTSLSCTADKDMKKEQVDIYFLVREYSKGELTRTFATSPFHFLEWPRNRAHPCVLKPADREALSEGLNKLTEKPGRR